MSIGIGFDGSMVIKDSTGRIHKFCPIEAKQIGTAWYKYVQNKRKTGVFYNGI